MLAFTTLAHAMTVEEFRALPDNRIAVRTSFGLRSARAVGKDRVEVVLGASVGPACGNPKAYRVIGFHDPRYAFEKFVMPVEASTKNMVEATAPAGCPFPRFERTIVTLRLPFALLANEEYYLVAQGADGAMVTAGHTAQRIVFSDAKDAQTGTAGAGAVDLAVLGLRQIESVGSGLLRVEFGPDFSSEAASVLANYSVSINGKTREVLALGRISRVDTYVPAGWPYRALPEHDVFVQLSKSPADGDRIEVSVTKAVTTTAANALMIFDARASISNSIRVNQVGYLTDSPVKMAYLGRWLGSFPEKSGKTGERSPALSFAEAPEFHVCSAANGKPAFTGRAKLVHRTGEKNEGIYKVDHSGENVYLLDFSSFMVPGHYYVSIDGVGRSLSFDIGDNVYRSAFEMQAYGVFAQRCGIELKPPYSQWRRIVCHDKGLLATNQIHSDKHDLSELPGKVVNASGNKATAGDGLVIHASGGHHDAGDYNPRSHLDIAQKLMDAYEMAPRKFYDGQLNIPEGGNGIPDILDEAYWALRLWIGLQDADGGVRDGVESRGDPNFIQTVELDDQGDYAYAKDAAGSFYFAGAMAQASRLWRSVGKTTEADDFLSRGRRAYDWAIKSPPKPGKEAEQHQNFTDPKSYAAAQLLHTTGEARFNHDFLESCIWTTTPKAEIESYQKYDQSLAAWTYVNCDPAVANADIQIQIRAAILQRADLFIRHSSTMAYGFIRNPYSPINWGTGAYENHLTPVVWAWKLTGDARYRSWMIRTCDNTLGANPLNLSYIVGLGTRTVRAPLHNSRYGHAGEVANGMQVEGPVQAADGYDVLQTAWPKPRPDFAPLYSFVDAHFAIGMDEGLVVSQAQSMAVFGLLLADHQK